LPCVANRVDPEPHLLSEWQAFAELRTDRPVGFDVGAIPWSSIDAYARRHAIEADEFPRLVSLIRALDLAERVYLRKKKPDADT
jgi:hypothetical protein